MIYQLYYIFKYKSSFPCAFTLNAEVFIHIFIYYMYIKFRLLYNMKDFQKGALIDAFFFALKHYHFLTVYVHAIIMSLNTCETAKKWGAYVI